MTSPFLESTADTDSFFQTPTFEASPDELSIPLDTSSLNNLFNDPDMIPQSPWYNSESDVNNSTTSEERLESTYQSNSLILSPRISQNSTVIPGQASELTNQSNSLISSPRTSQSSTVLIPVRARVFNVLTFQTRLFFGAWHEWPLRFRLFAGGTLFFIFWSCLVL